MATQECTEGVTLDELLNRPTGLLVLVGAEDDPADADNVDDSDEDEDDDEDADADADDDDEEDDDDSDEKSKKKKSKKLTETEQEIADLKEDRDRHKRRRAAGEERITKLLADIEDLKGKGTTDEKLKGELADTTKERDNLRTQNETLQMQVAFISDTSVKWKDPEAALRLVDLSDVTFENGKAVGLGAALRKLAKEKAYLVDTGDKPKPPRERTGDKPATKGRQTDAQKQAAKAKHLDRYPALRK